MWTGSCWVMSPGFRCSVFVGSLVCHFSHQFTASHFTNCSVDSLRLLGQDVKSSTSGNKTLTSSTTTRLWSLNCGKTAHFIQSLSMPDLVDGWWIACSYMLVSILLIGLRIISQVTSLVSETGWWWLEHVLFFHSLGTSNPSWLKFCKRGRVQPPTR